MDNKTQSKKEWTKPELTVLVRNNPEEQVLTGCKLWPETGSGQDDSAGQCRRYFISCGTDCNAQMQS